MGKKFFSVIVSVALLVLGSAGVTLAADPSGPFMAASSQISRLTILAVVQALIDFFLVAVLAVEMFFILNLGLLSKRSQDRATLNHPEPSDLNLLKKQIWPDEPEVLTVLPAEEEPNRTAPGRPSEEEKKEAA